MFDAELNKGVVLPISDLRPSTNQENDMFPARNNDKDVFTPPIEEGKPQEEENNKFFITGGDVGGYTGTHQQPNDTKQEQKNVIKELRSQESGDDEEHDRQAITNAEKALQGKNMFDDDQENIDFGKAKMDEFKKNAMELLLNNNETEYETPLDLPGAYKVLKGLIKNPVIVHSKRPNKGYMKQTFATSRHAVAVKGDEQRFLEYSKLSKHSKTGHSKSKLGGEGDDLKLPPILAIKEGESEYVEPTLLEKLEGFAGKPKQKLSKKQEKVNQKVELLLEADRKRMQEESLLEGEMSGKKKDPKKMLREKHGFSDSEDY